MTARIASAVYLLTVLGLLLVVVPWQVLRFESSLVTTLNAVVTGGAVALWGAGAVSSFAGGYYLVRRGNGTLLPWHPPQRLVVAGPYAYLQHPMYSGVLAMTFGQAMWYRSAALAVYGLGLAVLTKVYVSWLEERALRTRFGDDYDSFRTVTPRWVPIRPF